MILTSLVSFWESGSQFEDGLNVVVPRVERWGVGVCIWEVGGRFDLMVGFCFSLQSSRAETRLDYHVVSFK